VAISDNYETPLSPDEGYFLLENATTPEVHSKHLTESLLTESRTAPSPYEVPSPRVPESAASNTDHGYAFPFQLDMSTNDSNYETPLDADDATNL